MNVVCLGDCGIDEYETTGDRLPGGITLNFALQARRAFPPDDAITIVSALGTDLAAALIGNALKMSGVECDFTTLEGTTPVQRIALEPDGERRFTGYDPGVLERFRPSATQRAVIEQAGWLVTPHFVQIAGLFDAVLKVPRRGHLAVDFADFRQHPDFGLLERSLAHVDIAFFGLHVADLEILAAIEQLARDRDRLLVVTLGGAGSLACDGSRTHRQAAIPVPAVVDTTGAGDAFAAGFLSRHCHGAPVTASLEAGARHAAAAIQQLGGNHWVEPNFS
jgi:fructoselysine 6-kinase